jgi:hypothetical protein
MYGMYPEWGPAKNNPDNHADNDVGNQPGGKRAVQVALDLRDNGGERPDDN